MADQRGMPPVPYDGVNSNSLVADTSTQTFVRPGPNSAGRRTGNNKGGFNIKGVVEVLTEFGLDPVAELATALQRTRPAYTRDAEGRQVPQLDAKGKQVMEPVLDETVRVKVLTELTNFVHPKLKAVEMTVKKKELTDEQLSARVASLVKRLAEDALK
jgi:hypothetical protein